MECGLFFCFVGWTNFDVGDPCGSSVAFSMSLDQRIHLLHPAISKHTQGIRHEQRHDMRLDRISFFQPSLKVIRDTNHPLSRINGTVFWMKVDHASLAFDEIKARV